MSKKIDITKEAIADILAGVTPGGWFFSEKELLRERHPMGSYDLIATVDTDGNGLTEETNKANMRFISWASRAVPALAADRDILASRLATTELMLAQVQAELAAMVDANGTGTSKACEPDTQSDFTAAPTELITQSQRNAVVPSALLTHTFAVQYNPNCPSPWLVRLPGGSAIIDMKPYSSFTPQDEMTLDRLGFGKTFQEAAACALSGEAGAAPK